MKRLLILFFLIICLVAGILLIYFNHKFIQNFQDNQIQKISYLEQELNKNYRRISPIHLPVLLYHYVENVTDMRDTIRQSLNINPFVFEAQIKTLLNNNYHFVTFDMLINYYEGVDNLPQNPIILTFDDGYKDFYSDVFPILQKYQIPAVLYVVSGFVDSTHNYVSREELQVLAKSPFVEIGSHSVKHYNLSLLEEKELFQELVQSKKDLEFMINKPVVHFAYPNGGYNAQVIKYTKEAGYVTAVTTDLGSILSYQQLFQIKRIRPGRNTDEFLLNLLK